jgi:hypothetical protein
MIDAIELREYPNIQLDKKTKKIQRIASLVFTGEMSPYPTELIVIIEK